MTSTRLILIAALLITTAGSILFQPSTVASTPVAYIALGDSIAFGIGSSLPEKRGYPALLTEHVERITGNDVTLYNHAVPGETAATFMTSGQVDALASTRQRMEEQGVPIELVTVSLGGNEMLAEQYSSSIERQQALGEFRDTLDVAVRRIREEVGTDPEIVLTTYYDLSEGDSSIESSDAWWIEQFNQVIAETAERYDAVVADILPAFRGRIEELTLHPYDVHPRNQGYRAIARQVLASLGLDTDAPSITVVSDLEATRRTPTLQVEVTDVSGVESVQVQVADDEPVDAVAVGDDRYVLLLDLRDSEAAEVPITIVAEDVAGNSGSTDVQLVLATR